MESVSLSHAGGKEPDSTVRCLPSLPSRLPSALQIFHGLLCPTDISRSPKQTNSLCSHLRVRRCVWGHPSYGMQHCGSGTCVAPPHSPGNQRTCYSLGLAGAAQCRSGFNNYENLCVVPQLPSGEDSSSILSLWGSGRLMTHAQPTGVPYLYGHCGWFSECH